MCLSSLKLKKTLFSAYRTLLLLLSAPQFWNATLFYKAHRSEKWGVLWLTSYQVCCDWLNTSSVWQKCYAPYHIWKHSISTTLWRWQHYYSENKSYEFFLCVYIWMALFKSSHTVILIYGDVFKWGNLGRDGWVLTFRKNISEFGTLIFATLRIL